MKVWKNMKTVLEKVHIFHFNKICLMCCFATMSSVVSSYYSIFLLCRSLTQTQERIKMRKRRNREKSPFNSLIDSLSIGFFHGLIESTIFIPRRPTTLPTAPYHFLWWYYGKATVDCLPTWRHFPHSTFHTIPLTNPIHLRIRNFTKVVFQPVSAPYMLSSQSFVLIFIIKSWNKRFMIVFAMENVDFFCWRLRVKRKGIYWEKTLVHVNIT